MPITVPGATADYLSFVDGTGAVALSRLPKKTQKVTRLVNLLHFDGLTYPRAYFGENQDETWDVEYRVAATIDGDQWAALVALLGAGSVLLWRDVHGNSTYCVVGDASQAPVLPMPQPLTDLRFSLTRVTYP